MCTSEECQEAVWCGVSGNDQAKYGVVAFKTRQGTVRISLPPCTASAPCSESSSTACRITGSWQKAAGKGMHLHRCNLVKMSSISVTHVQMGGTSRPSKASPVISHCSCSSWSQVVAQCFIPTCGSAIRFIAWLFFPSCSWIHHLGSVISVITPCHHSYYYSMSDLGCDIPGCSVGWEMGIVLLQACHIPATIPGAATAAKLFKEIRMKEM